MALCLSDPSKSKKKKQKGKVKVSNSLHHHLASDDELTELDLTMDIFHENASEETEQFNFPVRKRTTPSSKKDSSRIHL